MGEAPIAPEEQALHGLMAPALQHHCHPCHMCLLHQHYLHHPHQQSRQCHHQCHLCTWALISTSNDIALRVFISISLKAKMTITRKGEGGSLGSLPGQSLQYNILPNSVLNIYWPHPSTQIGNGQEFCLSSDPCCHDCSVPCCTQQFCLVPM